MTKIHLVPKLSQRQFREDDPDLPGWMRELKEFYESSIENNSKNNNFVQIYHPGFDLLRKLIKKSPNAACLYLVIAEWMEAYCGALPADLPSLAHEIGVSTRSVDTYLKLLEDENALIRVPFSGCHKAYALNPDHVWKSYDSRKKHSIFVRKTIAGTCGFVRKKLMVLFKINPLKNKDKKG